jgi:CRISPR-associated protein Csb1
MKGETAKLLGKLGDSPRILLEADLKPAQGARFQATGFPDLGPATYTLPDGTEMLLVESAQSMSNRLEAVCWDPVAGCLIPELLGLPYVSATLSDGSVTNSILEAHRVNSPYILTDKEFKDKLVAACEYDPKKPLNVRAVSRALLKYDPNCLIHGTFLSNIEGGRIKIARALSAFIEAGNVREVASGGVKNDCVNPSGDTSRGFGNVPFHRTEFTAESITAFFNLDLALLRGYALGDEAFSLLALLSLLKIRKMLRTGLRLRTACDFTCNGVKVTMPEGFTLPEESALADAMRETIKACSEKGLFADPPVTELKVTVSSGKSKKGKKDDSEGQEETDSEDE